MEHSEKRLNKGEDVSFCAP